MRRLSHYILDGFETIQLTGEKLLPNKVKESHICSFKPSREMEKMCLLYLSLQILWKLQEFVMNKKYCFNIQGTVE